MEIPKSRRKIKLPVDHTTNTFIPRVPGMFYIFISDDKEKTVRQNKITRFPHETYKVYKSEFSYCLLNFSFLTKEETLSKKYEQSEPLNKTKNFRVGTTRTRR